MGTDLEGRPRKVWQRGALILTNQKLHWLDERGIFGKSYHLVTGTNLENVKGVSMGGNLWEYVTVADVDGSLELRIDGIGQSEFPRFKQVLTSHIESRKSSAPQSSDWTRMGSCSKCQFPLSISTKGFEAALADPDQWPLTIQGVCPKCGTKNVMLQEVPAVCDYCKKAQTKKGQTQCSNCGAPYSRPSQ